MQASIFIHQRYASNQYIPMYLIDCWHKVYAADMPSRLPPVLLIRRLAQQCFFALIFALRAIVVGIVWLALLPWATVWTWRMYFTMGDSTYALIFSCLLIFLPDITHRAWWIS